MSRGAPNRLIYALLALAAALALAACGSSSDSGSGDSGGAGDGSDVFTTAAFQKTLDAVQSETGEDAELLEVQLTTAGTDYKIRSGEMATGLHFDPGSSDGQDVQVDLIGAGSVADSAFPISDVDPLAIDSMVSGSPQAIDANDFKITVMTLGTALTGGELGWTINGDASGRTGLVLQAAPDGGSLTAPGGTVPGGPSSGTDPPATGTNGAPSATVPTDVTPNRDPAEITKCIQDAGGDVAKIQACAGR